VLPARSGISLTEGTGINIAACEGVAFCCLAGGLIEETLLAVAIGVDHLPLVLDVEDIFRPERVIIFSCFLNLLFINFEPLLQLLSASQCRE
jgi:hypothetical protein